MLRNVVIHINGEQPLLADIYEAPSPGDVGLRCTNLRQMNGKRPVFVEDIKSIFFFPYQHIRFVEIPPGTVASGHPSLALTADGDDVEVADTEPAEPETDLEIDEDFLRRIREV